MGPTGLAGDGLAAGMGPTGLAADLRCLDAHAHLGIVEFSVWEPGEATTTPTQGGGSARATG